VIGLATLYGALFLETGPFKMGYCFGLGFFGFSLYWVNYAMLVDISRFWWIIPIGLTAIPGVLGLFTACATWVFSRLKPALKPWTHSLLFAFILTLVEWVCGHYFFTGFPWCLMGYTWSGVTPVCQLAALAGVYGLSFFMYFISAHVGTFIFKGIVPRPAWYAGPLSALMVTALLLAWGSYRLITHPTVFHDQVIRLVQPNIEQTRKWNFEATYEVFQEHLTLSDIRGLTNPIALVVLPESAISWLPKFLEEDNDRRTYMAHYLQKESHMIVGASRFITTPEGGQVFNSLLAIDDAGVVKATFDKFHLLPFGEYLPLRQWLEQIFPGTLRKFTAGERDFTPGPGPRTISLGAFPSFSPLICYEVVFPHCVIDPSSKRPEWLLNITNDGWFYDSLGPYQHLHIARMRTIEEGLPLTRVANTGISAMIDPCGRILQTLALGTTGVIDTPLPKAIPTMPPYAMWGDWILLWAGIILMAAMLFFGRRSQGSGLTFVKKSSSNT
jgi:apolipoprotein N-acyltransferase